MILEDYSASFDLCVSQHRHWRSLSCCHQAESCNWRYLHVCSSSYAGKRALIPSCNNLSWETVFTAGFELDVLQRKRPYRWTIWVSFLLHMWPCHHVDEIVIPRNPLHRLTFFHLLLHSSGRLKSSVSGKASAVLGIKVEVVINVHFLQPLIITTLVRTQYRFPYLLNESLTSPGNGLFFLGIRIPHHHCPHASHHFDSAAQ